MDMTEEQADIAQVEAQEKRTPYQQELRKQYASKEGKEALLVMVVSAAYDKIEGRLFPHPDMEGFYQFIFPRFQMEGYNVFTAVQIGPSIVVPGKDRILGVVVTDE